MMQGFYASITGLQTNQYGLDVIADNLANVETVGFKSSTAEFANLFGKVLSSDAATPTYDDIGYGAYLNATNFDFAQGNLMPTENKYDLAIDGNGWFAVTGLGDKTYFTRDGQFHFDVVVNDQGAVTSSASRLVDPSGMIVQGTMGKNFTYDPNYDYGDLVSNGVSGAYVLTDTLNSIPMAGTNEQSQLIFPTRLAYPAVPTTTATFSGNIGTDAETRTISGYLNAANGDKNIIKLSFTKSATQPGTGISWDVTATVTSKDGATVYDTQSGNAVFDDRGSLISTTLSTVDNNGTPVAINLGNGFNGITANKNAISSSFQADGLEQGLLTDYFINQDGVITAEFSNGRQSVMGQVALYHFRNNQGLNREGGTYYVESSNSGEPKFWTDANGNYIPGAYIRSGYVETSNVRTEVAMTDMIIAQRAYQANSKIITTVDEMIQKALGMHR